MSKHKYTDEEVAEWRKTHRSFLYYNKDDSNYSVPKPYGFGRTPNWAHPVSWIMAAALVALIVYYLFFKKSG